MTRQEIIDFCLTFPNTYEDYPFDKVKDENACTVMRHKLNKKTFALIQRHGDELYLNLKCNPAEADFLRSIFKSVIPGYHMNKRHWNSVIIGGDVPVDELKRMVENSYNLIKPKVKKEMKLIVNKNKCPQNHKCPSIAVCPKGAISQKDIYSLPEVDNEKCVLCGKCMQFCPKGAFEKI